MRRTVSVVEIVDGCSFRIGSGQTIVVHGVPPCGAEGLKLEQVRERLQEMLLHRHVQLEDIDTDPQGRVIARVWADGEELGPQIAAMEYRLTAGVTRGEPAAPKKVEIAVSESLLKPPPAK